MWTAFRELHREAPDVMSHGDLTPGNVLTASGRLAGVLDVGSYGAADPALDLISAWNLLEAGPRQVLRTALECTSLAWERGKAWAFQQAMGLVWYYADPLPEAGRIKGLVCFFNEKVDLELDGELQECPETPWSHRTPKQLANA